MHQVLFRIPPWSDNGLPIFGFGAMLFLAFLSCTWLAGRLAVREGIPQGRERMQDLALWLFIGGLIGARLVYMIQYGVPLADFYKIWEGGIVFYGSFLGGWAGYGVAYWFVFRKLNVSTWQLADVVAPCIALGLALGRIGCFLNGCCYGHVACPECVAVEFPLLTSPARDLLVDKRGWQTLTGFTLDETRPTPLTVGRIEPGSSAERAGLQPGDQLVSINGRMVHTFDDLNDFFYPRPDGWPRGKTDLQLVVRRGEAEVALPTFVPRTLGLHPTQVYETISMTLLFVLLMAFFPLRRHHGQVLTVFMACYAIHRFLNEQLRNDTDPVFLGLTLSQNGSILIALAAGAIEAYLRWSQPSRTVGSAGGVPVEQSVQ